MSRLESAALKLERARFHTQALADALKRSFENQPAPAFWGRFEDDDTSFAFYVERGFEPIPVDPYSAILGDALHNLRCALDHVAWQLVCCGDEPNPARPRDVQFPIYDSAAAFERNKQRRLPGVRRAPMEFVQSRLADPEWDDPSNPLRQLAELSNADKHRSIHLLATGLLNVELSYDCTDCEVVGFEAPPLPPPMEPGTPVGKVRVTLTGPEPKMRMRLGAQPRVTLEDRSKGIPSTIERIAAEVDLILNAPEITAAVS